MRMVDAGIDDMHVPFQRWSSLALQSVCSLLLLLSAVLNAELLWRGGAMSLFSHPLPLAVGLVLVCFDILAIAWMWCPWLPAWRRMLFIGFFSAFALLNALAALNHETHCDCFGRAAMPIIPMVGIDSALAVWWAMSAAPISNGAISIIAVILAAGPPLFVSLVPAHAISESPRPVTRSQPLPPGIDGETLADVMPLAHGSWTVVMYRDDCPHCQRVLWRWVESSTRMPRGILGHRWAFVAIGDKDGPGLLEEDKAPPHCATIAHSPLRYRATTVRAPGRRWNCRSPAGCPPLICAPG